MTDSDGGAAVASAGDIHGSVETAHEVELQPEAAGAGHGGEIHLPPTSLWPITLAFAITLSASGLVLNWLVSVPGLVLFVIALRGWIQELLHAKH
jgi:hypothetical protein